MITKNDIPTAIKQDIRKAPKKVKKSPKKSK